MDEASKPLPEHVDRCGDFYIRYDVRMHDEIPGAIDAVVWEACEWTPAGLPVFFNAGPGAPGMDPHKTKPLFRLTVGWDGCSHLHMDYLHFDGLDEFAAFSKCVEYIYNDISDRHEVGE